MITDVLLDHAAAVPAAMLAVGLMCVALGRWALRGGDRGLRVLRLLAALSVLPVLALTLVPSGADRGSTGACTVQFALPGPGTVELLANIALFVPPVFFAALATRRPLAVLAAGSAASAVVEAVQALVPALGRACDTNDWAMNSTGALVAVLLAAITVALARQGADGAARRGSRSG